MTEPLVFRIPNAPGVNNLYRNVPGKGRVKTKAYKDWQYRAAWAMKLDGTTTRSWATITGPVIVEIVSGNHRKDSDGPVKAILDVLTLMKVYADDKQVIKHTVSRSEKPCDETIVTVTPAQVRTVLSFPGDPDLEFTA
jgi:Holliday junction resolvase RusA-like endonuclease